MSVPLVPWWLSTAQNELGSPGWLVNTGAAVDITPGFWASELQNATLIPSPWWVNLGKIYEDVVHWPGNWSLGNRPSARLCTISDLTIQGYKDKYSPHATIHLEVYLNDAVVQSMSFYPSGMTTNPVGTIELVDSRNRIYKYYIDTSFIIPPGSARLKVKVWASNSNEEAVSVGWAGITIA